MYIYIFSTCKRVNSKKAWQKSLKMTDTFDKY